MLNEFESNFPIFSQPGSLCAPENSENMILVIIFLKLVGM